ncbi:MAG: DUF4150 domain-containing protein [Krumholzibacteria bacterium]|nr:DUF4150 domain-containing protein [Candidatus Krumholzibacteria bacterium]
MPNKIFANGMEVACKAGAGKTICAFPDVCFTPPQTPATPPGVPIPYPNTGMASDTTGGTKKVKISDKEVGIKNQSHFKKSSGDEAGSAPKKGVVTSQNRGKVYFISYSMDVKFEGKNAVRHLDMTTNNHAGAMPGDTPPWPFIDSMAFGAPGQPPDPCADEKKKEKEACSGQEDPCPPEAAKTVVKNKANARSYSLKVLDGDAGKCLQARRCKLSPYKPKTCCPGQTPHHLVEASAFHAKGRGTTDPGKVDPATGENVRIAGVPRYDPDAAPCVCAEGGSGTGTHGMMHTFQSQTALDKPSGGLKDNTGGTLTAVVGKKKVTSFPKTTLADAQANGVNAFKKTFPESSCSEKCLLAQLKDYHEKKCGIAPGTEIKAVATFSKQKLDERLASAGELAADRAGVANRVSSVNSTCF